MEGAKKGSPPWVAPHGRAASRIAFRSLAEELSWPRLAEEAYQGVAGELVARLEPHTEADPVALLGHLLTLFGSVVGRGPHFLHESKPVPLNLFLAVVGGSPKSRKGTSLRYAQSVFDLVEPPWSRRRVAHGLASGEGLVWAVRDGEGWETEDRRLLLVEDLSAVVALARRRPTLLPVLEDAWAGRKLSTFSKRSPAVASKAHVSLIVHGNHQPDGSLLGTRRRQERLGSLFLWLLVRRSKLVPFSPGIEELDLEPILERLRRAVSFAQGSGTITFSPEARRRWEALYPLLTEPRPGLPGRLAVHGEVHVRRLAGLYALLDRTDEIRTVHLQAALAVWEYAEASVAWIFGGAENDPLTERISRALHRAPGGLSRTQLNRLFSGHRRRAEIDRSLEKLEARGLAACRRERTPGRSREIWQARRTPPGTAPSPDVERLP